MEPSRGPPATEPRPREPRRGCVPVTGAGEGEKLQSLRTSRLTPWTALDLMPPANLGLARTKTSPASLPPSRSRLSGHPPVFPASQGLPPGLLKHRGGQTSLWEVPSLFLQGFGHGRSLLRLFCTRCGPSRNRARLLSPCRRLPGSGGHVLGPQLRGVCSLPGLVRCRWSSTQLLCHLQVPPVGGTSSPHGRWPWHRGTAS